MVEVGGGLATWTVVAGWSSLEHGLGCSAWCPAARLASPGAASPLRSSMGAGGGVVRMITRGRLMVTALLAIAGLALPAISYAAPRVAAAARTGPLGPTACPAARTFKSLPLFAHVKKADDVMVDSNGNVWVSNVGGNQVTKLSPAGTVVHVFADRQNPEGMVQLSASTIAVANQSTDQVVVLDT